jgi:hypothetical protein
MVSAYAGDVLRPVWQVEMDNGAWMDYLYEESQILDAQMTIGETSFHMTPSKWLNYVFVLDGTCDDIPGLRGTPSEHQMFQYNTQSHKQRRIRRIIVLLD